MGELTCMNCGQPVDPSEAKVFATVFCCPRCFLIAETMLRRGEQELKKTLFFLRERIRVAMVQGQLNFAEPTQVEELSKKDVLQAILKLQELKDARLASLDSRDPAGEPKPPPGSSKYARKGGG